MIAAILILLVAAAALVFVGGVVAVSVWTPFVTVNHTVSRRGGR